MSFKELKDKISYGDTVFLHIGYDNMLPIMVKKGQTFQTKYGAVRHDSLVGKSFGTRHQCPRGWIYLLHPTPELWTISLPHRTQILYSTDISMIIFQLDLKPGSVIVESGTGSGSLSHSLIRSIMPTGHLHTFEFHKERSEIARQEFITHGLADYVTVTHRDVCGEGFKLDKIADAVFLDLPKPWDCMESAKAAIRPEGGRICSFSPCIEQVQRTYEELNKLGFTDITTMECLARNYKIHYAKMQNVNFGKEDDSISQQLQAESKDSVGKANPSEAVESEDLEPKRKVAKEDTQQPAANEVKEKGKESMHCFTSAVPEIGQPGHTGFLTFATLRLNS